MATTQTATARAVRQPKAPKAPKPMSATQRNKLATQGIASALGVMDEKSAVTATLEAVNERLAWDTSLRERMTEKYEELQALAKTTTNTGTKVTGTAASRPTPIAGPEIGHYSVYGKYDPYKLLEGFGRDQLRAVLTDATPALLREATDIVQSREPGTKPTSRSAKKDMINYIVEKVAGPGY